MGGGSGATKIMKMGSSSRPCSHSQHQYVSLLLLVILVHHTASSLGSATLIINNTSSSSRYNNRQVSSLRVERIERHLRKINKPAVVWIESPDGDVIDCVERRKQAALDHPLLKNHKIQKAPSKMPGGGGIPLMKKKKKEEERASEGERMIRIWQMWHRNGTGCPKGTVPIRRSTVEDVLRAKSLFHFGKKHKQPSTLDAPDVVSANGHEVPLSFLFSTTN